MQKLYCYVDETGQDTKGELFIVSVVVTNEQRDELLQVCEQIERETEKSKRKWHKAPYLPRLEYMRKVVRDDKFKGVLRYLIYHHTKDYDLTTVTSIVKAVNWQKPEEPFTTLVYVDGLTKSKRPFYSKELHKLGLPTRKVKGIARDESDAFIRLADAVAGFVRDAITENNAELEAVLKRGKRNHVLIEI